jgi:tubulin-specific chaperone E
MADALEVGHRVEHASNRGTVRFVGPLPGRGECTVWVGVDWDDAARGKHDGSVDGVRRFQAAHPTSGSFLKASKLTGGGRRSLLDAIALRHGAARDTADLPATIGGVGGRTTLVGADAAVDRQTRVRDATRLTVRGMGVCCVGDTSALATMLVNLRHLDVAENLISNAQDILIVLRALPALHTFDLSGNVFTSENGLCDAEAGIEGLQDTAAHVMRVLVLNRCNLSWESILAVCRACSRLEELRLHRSNLSALRCSERFAPHLVLENLRILDLDGNCLSWSDIVPTFGLLPELEVLFVGNNSIDRIRFPNKEENQLPALFPKLATLSLSCNAIGDWRSISELWVLPSLRALRVIDVPLLEDEAVVSDIGAVDANGRGTATSATRDGVIARLGSLRVLDGSTIHPDERLYAEKRYLNGVLGQVPGSTIPEGVAQEHPRILELCKEYDVVLGENASNAGTVAMGERQKLLRTDLIYCSFINCGGLADDARDSMKLQLPVSMTVGKIYGLGARLFGRYSADDLRCVQLVDNAGAADERVVDLDDETRDLRHYGLEGGQAVCFNVRGRFRA